MHNRKRRKGQGLSNQAALQRGAPIVFNFAPEPSREQVERGVRLAVTAFLAAYRAPAK